MTQTNSISFAPELPIPLKGMNFEPFRRIRGRTDSQVDNSANQIQAKVNTLQLPTGSAYGSTCSNQAYAPTTQIGADLMNQMLSYTDFSKYSELPEESIQLLRTQQPLYYPLPLSNWQTKINANCQDFGPNLNARPVPFEYAATNQSSFPFMQQYSFPSNSLNQSSFYMKKGLNPNAKEFNSRSLCSKNFNDDYLYCPIEFPRKTLKTASVLDEPIEVSSSTPLKEFNTTNSDNSLNASNEITPTTNRLIENWSTSSVSSLDAPSRSKEFKEELFKTEMCRNLEGAQYCRYGANCRFAHSQEELRKVDRSQIYRVDPYLYYDKEAPMLTDNASFPSRSNQFEKFAFKSNLDDHKRFGKDLFNVQRTVNPLDIYFSPDNESLAQQIFESLARNFFKTKPIDKIGARIYTSWYELVH